MNLKRILAVLLITLPFFALAQPKNEHNSPLATTEKFKTLLTYISQFYVDSVMEDQLVEEAIISMLEKLDPHSIYIPKEEVEATNAPLKGNFMGIGIRFQILKDTIMVVNTIPGGPSHKLGIKDGDKIIKIENETVAGIGIKTDGVRERLLGEKNTKVKVTIQRKGEKKPLEFTITRDVIPLYSIEASYMARPEVGYIKLSNFAETSTKEFLKAVDSLKKQGMKSLILDLQGNGGGYLHIAHELCDEFIDGNKLLVYTEGRSFPRKDYSAGKTGSFEKGKLVILIDESSASASEIVTGAIQDWDRGLVVGRRSFGKGLVQKPVNLPDGSMVRITTQRYYTPSGRCIQKPYEEGTEAYHKEKYQRYLSGELTNKDSIKIPDSLKFQTRISKREVYGGGGIIPDIFVSFDTSYVSDYYDNLIRKGILNSFTLTYVDKNRKSLKKSYPDFTKFNSTFTIDDKLMEEFKTYAKNEGVEFDEKGYETSKLHLHTRIKAGIAQNLWDYPMFFQIMNEMNPTYLKAIEAVQGEDFSKYKLAFTDN